MSKYRRKIQSLYSNPSGTGSLQNRWKTITQSEVDALDKDIVLFLMETLLLVQDVCCLAAGIVVQRLKLLNVSDGQAMLKVVTSMTGPAIVIQAFCSQGRLAPVSLAVCGLGFLYSIFCHAFARLSTRKAHAKYRAVITGCSVGSATVLWSYPLSETVFGIVGLQSMILFGLSNLLAEHVMSYMNFASAGPAFPASYEHADGSTYRGQWDGLNKQGVGCYKYNSGATYEGEWRGNQKSGRGVYYFPKGGLYEGEWSEGNRNGIGIRTFSDGRYEAGRWMDNKLSAPLDLWQCRDAVMGATQTAKAAREVDVGGGEWTDALHGLLAQPILWATTTALVINFLNRDLSPTIDQLTRILASVHRPLALATAGLTVPFALSRVKELRSSLTVIGSRLVIGLLLSAAAAFGCYRHMPDLIPFVLPIALAATAPVSLQALDHTEGFRLNSELAATIVASSSVVSAAVLFGIAASMMTIRQRVWHSSLSLWLARMESVTAALVVVVLFLAAVAIRATSAKKLVLRKAPDASSDLDTEALQSMLRRTSPAEPPASSGADEQRGMGPRALPTRRRLQRRPLQQRFRRLPFRFFARMPRSMSLSRLNGRML